jgi:hypothetical protein
MPREADGGHSMNTVMKGLAVVEPRLKAGLRASGWLLVVPVVLYALAVLPFVFEDVLGEPDLERMALGLLYGAATGLHEFANYHYGYLVSFGYYQGLYHLLPTAVLLNSSELITAINYIGYASAVLAVAALGLYLSRLFGVRAAFATAMLFALSPVFLDLGTSGHPQLPGLALVLTGAWLLTYVADPLRRSWVRWLFALGSFAILVAAVCVRNDVALAFPFITLAAPESELATVRVWLRGAAVRLGVLLAVVLVYVFLETHAYHDNGTNSEFLSSFFESFYRLDTLPRGIAALLLASGLATVSALLALLLVPKLSAWRSRLTGLNFVAIALLAVPSLIFWLPNATPSRHLLFATLAVALSVGLLLARNTRVPQLVAFAIILPLTNQVLAEASHGLLVRTYSWEYPLLTDRRATKSVPMGAFPLDHEARQEEYKVLRTEGRTFARACTGHVVAYANEPHYMMMSLLELDRSVRFTSTVEDDIYLMRATGRRCTVDFVTKLGYSRRDVLRDILQANRFPGLPIYVQEARLTPYDRTPIPAERRFP